MNQYIKYFKNSIFVALVALVIQSCEKPYVPNIDDQEPILVIEGLITDQYEQNYVRISKSMGFNDEGKVEYLSGYDVRIEEKDGMIWKLSLKSKGYYVTSKSVKGTIGKMYRILVTDPNGVEYASAYDSLITAAPVESIGGVNHTESWLEKSMSGGYIEKSETGVMMLGNLNSTGLTPFYRYEYELVFQTAQTYPTKPFATVVYIARPFDSKSKPFLTLANSNEYQQNHVVDHSVDFVSDNMIKMRVVLDSIELDTAGKPIFPSNEIQTNQFGFLVQFSQYSLSHNAFLFWEGVEKQMKATGHLFDPIESRLKGNMICLTDSTQLVFGYFGASAITQKANHLYKRYDGRVVVKDVIFFPDLRKEIASYTPFDFWVR